MRRAAKSAGVLVVAALAGGCADEVESPSTPATRWELAVDEAERDIPTFFELQATLFTRTCSPNPGVCHQMSTYPELHTAERTLALLDAPCNVEPPDPTQGWDGCERPADRVTLGPFETEIAAVEVLGGGSATLSLREPAPASGETPVTVRSSDGDTIFAPPEAWGVVVLTTAGSIEATLITADEDARDDVDGVLATLIEGDPNRNGVFGAEGGEPGGALVARGSPERSYLLARMLGTVPGSVMPLANGPVTDAELAALACFIEGLGPDERATIDTEIRYEACTPLTLAERPEP